MIKPEINGGDLMVGIGPNCDVIINLDHDRTGHLIFHPNQARALAELLMRKADEAEVMWANLQSYPSRESYNKIVSGMEANDDAETK